MNIKEKVELALKLLKESQDEILNGDLPKTKANQQIKGLVSTFGESHVIGGVKTMRKWVSDLDLNE